MTNDSAEARSAFVEKRDAHFDAPFEAPLNTAAVGHA